MQRLLTLGELLAPVHYDGFPDYERRCLEVFASLMSGGWCIVL